MSGERFSEYVQCYNAVVDVLRQPTDQLHAGAIVTIDEMTSRLRILPIQRKSTPSH
jgi:hypothetical protein